MKAREISVSVTVSHTTQLRPYEPTQLRGFASVTFDVEESDGHLDDEEIQMFVQERFNHLWNEVGDQVTTQIKELDE